MVLLSHGRNKAFPVPDSCRAAERNGDSITAVANEKRLNGACFNDGCH